MVTLILKDGRRMELPDSAVKMDNNLPAKVEIVENENNALQVSQAPKVGPRPFFELPSGGWRTTGDWRGSYTTKDGYVFNFFYQWRGTFYWIWLMNHINYAGRPSDGHVTHRYYSEVDGLYRICLGDETQLYAPYHAEKWAGVWAENTMNYILRGIPFPNDIEGTAPVTLPRKLPTGGWRTFSLTKKLNSKSESLQAGENLKMAFTEDAWRHISDTVGFFTPETGGLLLGDRKSGIVKKFFFDKRGKRSAGSYDPDVDSQNKTLKEEFQKGNEFLGMVHSHPYGYSTPSGDLGDGFGDMGYVKKIFSTMPDLDKFLMPIIFSEADGKPLKCFPYIVFRNDVDNYKLAKLEILKDGSDYNNWTKKILPKNFFLNTDKLKGSVDVELMKKSNVVCIGIGGANEICSSLVRTGLGNLTAVDFDLVSETNICTQGFLLSDIGRAKVNCLGEKLTDDINSSLNYRGVSADFKSLSPEEIRDIVGNADLILAMTDDFHCQAMINRVSLKYSIPAIFAMTYEKAQCAEVFFQNSRTPGCFRCATQSRYEAYENGFINNVTSNGSTKFHTEYLNALIGQIALAIIHQNSTEVSFANWFGNYWDRNFLQVRMHPQYSQEDGRLFNHVFKENQHIFCFDTVWQKIDPNPYCPDCGGIGNLNISSKFISLLQNPVFRKSEWLVKDDI